MSALTATTSSLPIIPDNSLFACFFQPYRSLEARISAIGQAQLTQEDWNALERGIALCRRWFFVPRGVQKSFHTLPIDRLQRIVNEILSDALERDISKELQRFLDVLSDKQIQELAGLRDQDQVELEISIKALLNDHTLKGLTKKGQKLFWNEYFPALKGLVHYILDLVISLSGVDEMGPERGGFNMSQMGAQYRLQFYLEMLKSPAAIFTLIYAYVQNVSSSIALTTIFVIGSMIFIGLYKRFLRPCPQSCSGLKNMVLDVSKEEEPRFARLDIFRQIENAFASKKGVLLVGDSGSGKTSIIEGFAERVREGKAGRLSRKLQFFSGNGNSYKGFDGFAHLEKEFRFWRKEVCFHIEEFHALLKKDMAGGEHSDSLKTFADTFPYISGTTTLKEYEEFVANHATIKRRFVIIKIKEMSKEQIISTLYHYLHAKQPELDISPEVMDKIYELAPQYKKNTSLVDAAIPLLSSAIEKMTDQNFDDIQRQIDAKEMEINCLGIRMVFTSSHSIQERDKLKILKEELTVKQTTLKTRKEQLARIKKIEKIYLSLKQKSFRLATRAENPALRREWLANEALLRHYGGLIRENREKLELPPCLNVALIEKIVAESSEKAIA